MRPELNEIEKIELYLKGKLQGKELEAFENQMHQDSIFKQKVIFQKGLITSLKNNSMKMALSNAHNNWVNASYAAPTTSSKLSSKLAIFTNLNSILIIVGLGLATLLTYYLMLKKPLVQHNNKSTELKLLAKNQVKPTIGFTDYYKRIIDSIDRYKPLFTPIIQPFEIDNASNIENRTTELTIHNYKDTTKHSNLNSIITEKTITKPLNIINPAIGGIIYDKQSGATITIPPNAFKYLNNDKTPKIDIEIIYKEYRNKAELAYSEIPMHWYGMDSTPYSIHTEGMFSILAQSDSGKVQLIKPIKIQFTPNALTDSLGLFYLADYKSRWKYVQEIKLSKAKLDSLRINEFKKFNTIAFKNGWNNTKNKPSWSEPELTPEGAFRYGFWGRLVEFISKGTVYGSDSLSLKRVFTEKRLVEKPNLSNLQIEKAFEKENEAAIDKDIIIKKLGIYGFNKLSKTKNYIKPTLKVFYNNTPLDSIYKLVVFDINTNSAYQYPYTFYYGYFGQLCLDSTKSYCFAAYSLNGKVYLSSAQGFSDLNNLKAIIVNCDKVIKSKSDLNNLFDTQKVRIKKPLKHT
ncbi:MAG: hypothetical protein ACPGLV_16430 [Bacteroidia bacterium]